MPANHTDLEKRLWDAADELRANSKLKSSEYSVPVLGLIFLRYADHKFTEAEKKIPPSSGRGTALPHVVIYSRPLDRAIWCTRWREIPCCSAISL
jgi:hypothetical protein